MRGGDRKLLASVVRLELVDTKGNTVAQLSNGAVIDLNKLSSTSLNVRAILPDGEEASTGSVKFGYNNNNNYRVENKAAYAFCGNPSPTDYYVCKEFSSAGKHTITATAFSDRGAGGTSTNPLTITFETVKGVGPLPAPVAAPVPSPVATPTAPTPLTSGKWIEVNSNAPIASTCISGPVRVG